MFEPDDVVECMQTYAPRTICEHGCRPSIVKGTYYRVYDVIRSRLLDSSVGIQLYREDHWHWDSSLFRKLEKGEDVFTLVNKTPVKVPELV